MLHTRKRRIGSIGATFVAAVAAVGLIAPGPATAATPPADVLVEWNAIATGAITGTAGQGPTVAFLHLAMVQGAVYDAVNGIDGGHAPYLRVPPAADQSDSMEAAAVTAAHDVLVGLFSTPPMTNSTVVATLDAQYAISLAAIGSAGKAGGIVVGQQAAARMLQERTGDGRFPVGYPAPAEGFGPGEWRRTPPSNAFEPAPWVGDVEPFFLASAAALRSNGPNALSSDAYAADFKEVKRYGRIHSTVRTDDQTFAALFWQANGAVLYNSAFRDITDRRNLDIVEAARLFAMGDLAGADGAIACWDDKYRHDFWRPLTAIHEAASDGNPATVADTTWAPLLPTPPFPEHPSGHGCISGAVVRTLQRFFGTDQVAFTATGTLNGVTRSKTFGRLSVAIREVIDARVWVGFHFRTADVQGRVLGNKVAHALVTGYFAPVG
jgi:hypothetical protein